MKTIVIRSLIIAVFASAGVSISAQSDQDITKKIEKNNDELAKAIVDGNVEKNMSFYAPDAISLPSYGPMVSGQAAIRKSSEEMMDSGMKVKSCTFDTKEVNVCDKMITEIGTYKMSISMPQSEETMEDKGKYLTIWEMQDDGSLKIKVEMWNTDKMPQM